VFEDAEVVDFAAPYGVFSVARRYDPALDVFLVAETLRPVQAQGRVHRAAELGLRQPPGDECVPDPRGAGTRPETYNTRLHEFIRAQPPGTLLISVCTGSWILAEAGLLDGLPATSRKEPDSSEAQPPGMVPIDRLVRLAPACQVSRARVVDAGRVIIAAGISAGMEMGFHLLRRGRVRRGVHRTTWRGSWNTPRPTRPTATTVRRRRQGRAGDRSHARCFVCYPALCRGPVGDQVPERSASSGSAACPAR